MFSSHHPPGNVRARRTARVRRGLTLIEMLIAVAVSLILIFALARVFEMLGDNFKEGRAIIEMSGQLRNVANRLQKDLDGATAKTLPWMESGAGYGYFEYVEGQRRDATAPNSPWGDFDDVLMLTSRSQDRPFIGRYNGGIIESEYAEVIWYVRYNDVNADTNVDMQDTITLYRRVLLIRPDLPITAADLTVFQAANDISARLDGTTVKPNSLADLALRENRFGHTNRPVLPPYFPQTIGTPPDGLTASFAPLAGNDLGHDVVLGELMAFDVQVYDPRAEVRSDGTTALTPNDVLTPTDPTWTGATIIGRGAYVDLNYAGDASLSFYSGPPNTKSKLTIPTYDTWPFDYESDGVDQDNVFGADQGTNGFDDAVVGGVAGIADDTLEYETAPPYPHDFTDARTPGLSGIRVKLRIMEPDTRQVRQVTVTAEFTPQ